MKGFKNSTRMVSGHDFTRTSTPVKPHMRAMPVKKLAEGGVLTAASRDALPKSDFALPGARKYPVNDKAHAANAKARASQQAAKGALSEAMKSQVDAKANKVLTRARGGAVRHHDTPLIKGC